jgi:hypothetical protein
MSSGYQPPPPSQPPEPPDWLTTVGKILAGIGIVIAAIGLVALLGVGLVFGSCLLGR